MFEVPLGIAAFNFDDSDSGQAAFHFVCGVVTQDVLIARLLGDSAERAFHRGCFQTPVFVAAGGSSEGAQDAELSIDGIGVGVHGVEFDIVAQKQICNFGEVVSVLVGRHLSIGDNENDPAASFRPRLQSFCGVINRIKDIVFTTSKLFSIFS